MEKALKFAALAIAAYLLYEWWMNVNVKPGVSLEGLSGPIMFALGVMRAIYAAFGQALTVTSTTEGVHPAGGANDPHYSGYAVDVRTNGILSSTVQSIFDAISAALRPLGFVPVLESDHIHVQYDGGSLFGSAPWYQTLHGGNNG